MPREVYIERQQVKYAAEFDEQLKITQRLGLNGDLEFRDRMLALLFLQRGLIIRGVTNSPRLLSSNSGYKIIPGIGLIAKMIDRINLENQFQDLYFLNLAQKNFLEHYYYTPETRLRARNIELAINDLLAKSTYPNRRLSGTDFNPSKEFLSSWCERWTSQLDKHTKY